MQNKYSVITNTIFYHYRKCMLEGMKKNEIKEYLSENVFGWDMVWKPRFCDKARCKFNKTNITKSYI